MSTIAAFALAIAAFALGARVGWYWHRFHTDSIRRLRAAEYEETGNPKYRQDWEDEQ